MTTKTRTATTAHTATITLKPADEWLDMDRYEYNCTCGRGDSGFPTIDAAKGYAAHHGCIGHRAIIAAKLIIAN